MWNIFQKYIVKKTVIVFKVHEHIFQLSSSLRASPSLEVFPETWKIRFLTRWVFGELSGSMGCQCKCRLNNQVTGETSVQARSNSNLGLLSCEAMCVLRAAGACSRLRGAETRKRLLLTLAPNSQAFANKLKGAFNQVTRQTAKSFLSAFVLRIPASLLMWIDSGQGEHLGKLYLYVLCWKCSAVVSRVRAYRPLSCESSINEFVILNWACYLNHIKWIVLVKKKKKEEKKKFVISHELDVRKLRVGGMLWNPNSRTVNWITQRLWDMAQDSAVCMLTGSSELQWVRIRQRLCSCLNSVKTLSPSSQSCGCSPGILQ